MDAVIRLRLVLVDPPAGIDYGIQKGRGSGYETLFVQRPARGDVAFDVPISIRQPRRGARPTFVGPFAQGPPADRFVYVDVGTYAGQQGTHWARRMKIPLAGIGWPLVDEVFGRDDRALELRIPATGSDGGPSCGTVKRLGAWTVITRA